MEKEKEKEFSSALRSQDWNLASIESSDPARYWKKPLGWKHG